MVGWEAYAKRIAARIVGAAAVAGMVCVASGIGAVAKATSAAIAWANGAAIRAPKIAAAAALMMFKAICKLQWINLTACPTL